MAVREYGEIKGIEGINVQENGVTQVSLSDTINIVGGGTVTDVGGVATINIPQGATWYREDVPAGSATYTFQHSPATSTSFLIFTDSGTLLFSGIDYTYDPDTETVTFLSLGANEAAYIWVANVLVNGGGIGDMVKAVYDPTNINSSAFDYNNFINTPTIGNATLKIQKNSTDVGSITMNATSDVTVDLSIPTTVSELTDSSNYITGGQLNATLADYALSENIPTATSELVNDSGFITSADVPTKTSDLVNDSGFITSAGDVYGPNLSTDGNIVVFDGATGKLIKDGGFKIQLSDSPSGSQCEVYYDNGTIYLKVLTPSNILLENGNDLITEDNKNIILE